MTHGGEHVVPESSVQTNIFLQFIFSINNLCNSSRELCANNVLSIYLLNRHEAQEKDKILGGNFFAHLKIKIDRHEFQSISKVMPTWPLVHATFGLGEGSRERRRSSQQP